VTAEGRPPVTVELTWTGGLRFDGFSRGLALELDGDGALAVSPVQALAFALAGCMASDIVHILTKGRQPLQGFRAELTGRRAETDPRRLVEVDLRFVVTGDVPPDKVERAIALSRETYCSVWHSLRQDIEFTTSFEVTGRADSSST
jgi:putative redox protein